jgi:hypothetical protein
LAPREWKKKASCLPKFEYALDIRSLSNVGSVERVFDDWVEVIREMVHTNSLYEACHELFTGYPQAARTVNENGTVLSMVVMVQDGDHAGFYVLSQDQGNGEPSYCLWPWPAGDIVDITAESNMAVPDMAVDAVTRGVPIPRDGSLFGWAYGRVITALIVIYAESAPASSEPGWAVMPLAGTAEAQWPPFTGERLFGHWSWELCRAGRIISLDGFIAETPATIWWVDTTAVLGSNCCAIARDVTTSAGHTLRRGCYVYYQALRASKPIPCLEVLLRDPGKIDLASRFQRHRNGHGRPTIAGTRQPSHATQEYCDN